MSDNGKGPMLLDISQVARLLNVPEKSVKHLHRTDKLRGSIIGRTLLWKPAAVQRYVEQLEPSPTKPTEATRTIRRGKRERKSVG